MAAIVWVSTMAGEGKNHLVELRLPILIACVLVSVFWMHRYVVYVVCALVGLVGGAAVWNADVVTEVVPCVGVAQLLTDPTPSGAGVRAVVRQGGKRYAALAFGTPGRTLAQRAAGDVMTMAGTCQPLRGKYARSERVRHIVGKMSLQSVSEQFSEGNILLRSANRVRRAMLSGVSDMAPQHRALFTGLVVGDDRLQSQDMVARFRESGLSHLCAASGQNVAYLIAIASPLMRRKSAVARWLVTIGIIVWFVMLTRAEPSVVRAGFMAAMVATNALRRRPQNARVVLSWCVMILLVVDPMLAWSVSFGLSVGATAGLAWLSASFGRVWGGRGVIASTIAAQVGTLPVAVAVFGTVPVVSLLANPLALPVAGLVMTIGLPLSLAGALVPQSAGFISLALSLPVMWVDAVAWCGAVISPNGVWNVILWLCVAGWGVRMWRSKKVV